MLKRRLNGEGSIRKRADGSYEVRISLGVDFSTGKTKRISKYAATEEEAVQLLHSMSFANATSPNLFKETTLGEWLEMCLEVYMKNTLKQSTYNSYRTYIEKHFKPALGEVPLAELSPRMLQMFYNYKIETEGLAPKTVVNICSACTDTCGTDPAYRESDDRTGFGYIRDDRIYLWENKRQAAQKNGSPVPGRLTVFLSYGINKR